MNRIQAAKARQDFEKADGTPARGILGPVPSVAEQTAMLMADPGWLVREMRRQQIESVVNPPGGEEIQPGEDDFDDDEPEWFTGYETVLMDPIPFPSEDQSQPEGSAEEVNPPEAEQQGHESSS